MKIIMVIIILSLSGCSTSQWTVETDIFTLGPDDNCQARKSDIEICRRFK